MRCLFFGNPGAFNQKRNYPTSHLLLGWRHPLSSKENWASKPFQLIYCTIRHGGMRNIRKSRKWKGSPPKKYEDLMSSCDELALPSQSTLQTEVVFWCTFETLRPNHRIQMHGVCLSTFYTRFTVQKVDKYRPYIKCLGYKKSLSPWKFRRKLPTWSRRGLMERSYPPANYTPVN